MTLFLSLQDAAYKAFRTLCAALCEAIYPLMATCYRVFMDLATFKLIGTAGMQAIYSRVFMIMTIIMVFYVTFLFIKYTIEPDTMTDKEKGVGKLPQKLIIVVALLAFMPNIFVLLHNVQLTVIKNDVISKIILGKTYDTDNYTKMGNQFAWSVLTLFYKTDATRDDTIDDADCDGIPCFYVVMLNERDLVNNGTLRYLNMGINSVYKKQKANINIINEETDKSCIEFYPLWAVAVGLFVTFMLILYCVDLGSRTIQMVYLEVTAPIAIIGILSPKKDGIFQKWGKQLITTYLDVFIRLILINFVILVSTTILIDADAIGEIKNADIWVKIAIVLGMLVFAKKAPKLIEELFPKMGAAGGNFGLKPSDRNLGRVVGGALGLGIGAATGAATGLLQGIRKAESVEKGKGRKLLAGLTGATWGATRGTVGGAGRGLFGGASKSSNEGLGKFAKNTFKGAGGISKSNKTYGDKAAAGYTLGKQAHDKIGGAFGHSRKEDTERKKKQEEATTKQRESQNKRRSDDLERAEQKAMKEGKYYDNDRLKNEAIHRAAVKGKLADLEDPNSEARKAFKIGGEKQDAASQRKISDLRSTRDTSIAEARNTRQSAHREASGNYATAQRKAANLKETINEKAENTYNNDIATATTKRDNKTTAAESTKTARMEKLRTAKITDMKAELGDKLDEYAASKGIVKRPGSDFESAVLVAWRKDEAAKAEEKCGREKAEAERQYAEDEAAAKTKLTNNKQVATREYDNMMSRAASDFNTAIATANEAYTTAEIAANETYATQLRDEHLTMETQDDVDEAIGIRKAELGKELADSDDTFLAAYYDAATQIDASTGEVYDQVIADRNALEEQAIENHNDAVGEEYRMYKDKEIEARLKKMAKEYAFKNAPEGTYASVDAVPDAAAQAVIADGYVTRGDAEVKWRKTDAKREQQSHQLETDRLNAELEKINKETASAGSKK